MKYISFLLFDRSVGRFIRVIQSTLIQRDTVPIEYVTDLVSRSGIEESYKYAIQNMGKCMMFRSKKQLLAFCVDESKTASKLDSLILEFGVYKGESINYLASLMPNLQLYGFDSFKGLSENWYGTSLKMGHFNLNGKLPKCKKNVHLIQGWFEESLPSFVRENYGKKISILHIDCDTYSPTKYVLSTLIPLLARGSIIVFDEYFGYSPSWKEHEFKAFKEIVTENKLLYEYIAFSDEQVAVRLL